MSAFTPKPIFLFHDDDPSENVFTSAIQQAFKKSLKIYQNNQLEVALPYIADADPDVIFWSYAKLGIGAPELDKQLQRFAFLGKLVYLVPPAQEAAFLREYNALGPVIGFEREYWVTDWASENSARRQLELFIENIELRKVPATQPLQGAEETFVNAVLSSLSARIAVLDRMGNIKAVNESWSRFAREHGEKDGVGAGVGSNYLAALRSGGLDMESVLKGVEQVLGGDLPEFSYEYSSGASRERREFQMHVGPLKDQGGGAVITHQDITERKNLEQGFLQAQKMEAVGQLAGGIAHDFNNILMVILGRAEVLLRKGPDAGSWGRDLGEIHTTAERAARLTRQLLAFSRKQIMQTKVIDLNDLIDENTKMLRRIIGEDVNLTFVPGEKIGNVQADPTQLEQVIMNLAVNARDAMLKGGHLILETSNVEVSASVLKRPGQMAPGSYVCLSVRDTGAGMDEATRARIFEPFFSTKAKGKGTGLGLSTVYGIVKQSGGYIWATSEVSKGTTFKIYLPRVNREADPKRPPTSHIMGHRGTETILLVEDEEGVRCLLQEMLIMDGYRVLAAQSGEEALALIESYMGTIHAMLSDMVMPGMSGPKLAEQVLSKRPEVKVLFMTGFTNHHVVAEGQKFSSYELMEKPFDQEVLSKKLRKLFKNAPESGNLPSSPGYPPHARLSGKSFF